MRNRHEAVAPFARGLHQDVFVGLDGSLEDLADTLLENMSAAETEAFRIWLARALHTLTPSELKGIMNRASPAVGFSGTAAHELLKVAADRLGVDCAPGSTGCSRHREG